MTMREWIKYKIYRLQWRFASIISFKYPIHIDIETNNTCQQKCIMCWHSNPEKRPFKLQRMKKENVFDLLEQAKYIGTKSVKFNWRGDPSCYKDIIEVIKYAEKLGFIDIMMNTNGVYSVTRFDDLLKAGLTTMIISVDSFNKKNYCKIHGCDEEDFFMLMGNLAIANYGKKLYNSKCKIKLNYHVNKINKNESLGLYEIKFSNLPLIIRNTMKRAGKDISANVKKKKRKRICPHMVRRLTIAANGKVFPCCVSYMEPGDLFLGNVLKDCAICYNLFGTDKRYFEFKKSLKAIWDKIKRKELIKNYKKGIYTESCKNCTSGDIWK